MPRTSSRTPAGLDDLDLPPFRKVSATTAGPRKRSPSGRSTAPGAYSPRTPRPRGSAPARSPRRAAPASILPRPRLRAASPFRKHARDIAAIALFASGLVVLLSLYFRTGSIGLGAYLQALLGWGAPATGIALLLLGAVIAAGPGRLAGAEIRAGIVILLIGFLTFAGLLNNHTRGGLGDGGDIGNHLAAALLALLDSIAGDGAAYSCAQVIVGAFNLVGFLMVTDRPLMHWARLGRLICSAARRRLPRGPTRSTLPDAEDFALGAVLDTSKTRRSRRPGAVSAADSETTGKAPSAISPTIEASTQPDRPTVIHGEPEDRAPIGDQPVNSGARPMKRSVRERFDAALDRILPATMPEDGFSTGASNILGTAEDPIEDSGRIPGETDDDADSEYEVGRGTGGDEGGERLPPEVGNVEDELDADLAAILGAENRPPGTEGGPGRRGGSRPETAGAVQNRLPLEFIGESLPPAVLLNATPPPPRKSKEEAQTTVMTLERTLQEFKVEAKVVEIAEGPTLTRYEIQLAPGILVKKILSLADNIAMALAAIDVRVEAPIPGKSAIGVEIPKRTPGLVGLRELVDTPEFRRASPLTFALGKDVTGAAQYADLARMPHVLIAGSTGSGKSACLNTLITSILFRANPNEVQFMMIDPKRVELSLYDGIPHLCHQIVRDSRRAPQALGRAMAEMDRRYLLLQEARTRDITGYNNKAETPEQRLPYIVVVIDELADLMMTSGAETEHAITRIAQLARAVGIHLVVATQRPSVDIVTGKIKANISSRIAFAVSSGIDSRTILDCNGAERLIGRGDMLFRPIDASKALRIQGAYISEQELEKVVEFWRSKGRPDYYMERTPVPDAEPQPNGDAKDELYGEGVRVVLAAGQASTSMLQRRLKIGYNRAATLIELMEECGVVGPQDGVRPREVLISREQWELGQES